jgi:ComF family protein
MDLCNACETDLPWNTHSCDYCSLPLSPPDTLCGQCISDRPAFSALLTAFKYQFPVNRLISRFKDQRQLAAGEVLSQLLVNRHRSSIELLSDESTIIAPVPLHWWRRQRRGFNQSAIIASIIAAGSRAELDTRLLTRRRYTPDQKLLGVTDRNANVRGAFYCSSQLSGKRVLLVDDVVTSRATVNECTEVLYRCGASDVAVLALARTADETTRPA